MEIYSRAVIDDIAVDLRYRFNEPGALRISVTCAPPWVLYAPLEGPLSVAVRLLPLISVEYSLM